MAGTKKLETSEDSTFLAGLALLRLYMRFFHHDHNGVPDGFAMGTGSLLLLPIALSPAPANLQLRIGAFGGIFGHQLTTLPFFSVFCFFMHGVWGRQVPLEIVRSLSNYHFLSSFFPE